ncbi:hypothetical protein BU17DRAFT_89404 [Hysterangium stoloniferum]|nr:hypothetical protein BU17DRAFT_89404 [Hysterangium stoloniferum]
MWDMNNFPSHTNEETYSGTPTFDQGGYQWNSVDQVYQSSSAFGDITSNSYTSQLTSSNPQFHTYDPPQAQLEGHYCSPESYQNYPSSSGFHVPTHYTPYLPATHMEGPSRGTGREGMFSHPSSQVLPHYSNAPFPTSRNTEEDDSLPSESSAFGASLPMRPEWVLRPTSHPMVQSQRAYVCKLHGCTSPGNIVLKSHKASHERIVHGVSKPLRKEGHGMPRKECREAVSPYYDVAPSRDGSQGQSHS